MVILNNGREDDTRIEKSEIKAEKIALATKLIEKSFFLDPIFRISC